MTLNVRNSFSRTKWVVLHLLLVAFAVRALIPVGFMPTFGSGDDHLVKLVICTASGTKTIALDDHGTTTPDSAPDDTQAAHHDSPCAFSGLAVLSLPSVDANTLKSVDILTAVVQPNPAVQLPPTRAGPPVGSRGPPLHS